MPSEMPASTVRRSARVPARWPAAGGRPRRRAQRPFPSMMIATVSATSGSSRPSGSGRTRARVRMRDRRFTAVLFSPSGEGLHLHDLGFFALQEVVDLRDMLVGQLLHPALGGVLVVVADLAVLDQVLEVPHHVAADVPDGDPPLLGHVARDLDELLAPLLRELRN